MTTPAPPRLTLRQFVATVLADGVTDYAGEADRIVAAIPDADRDRYLAQALVAVIGEVAGARRRAAFDAALASTDVPADPDHAMPDAHTRGVGVGGYSRAASLREHWKQLIETTGLAASGGPMRVGDMTADDLLANIAHRERLARANVERAAQFRELHALLTAQGVARVDQIEVGA